MGLIIENKPIHIGKFVWKKKSKYCFKDVEFLEYCLTTGYSLVYFLLRSDIVPQGDYILFQYSREENTENVRFIGTTKDFELIETEYMDMDEMMRFCYFFQSEKAIIKPDLGIEQFYYFISGKFISDSNEDLYGRFNKNEELLLHEAYGTKPLF